MSKRPAFDLTPDERARLAAALDLKSDADLRHLQVGRRKASAAKAIRIEKAAKRLGLAVPRESICDDCKGCDVLKAARKAAKAAEGLF